MESIDCVDGKVRFDTVKTLQKQNGKTNRVTHSCGQKKPTPPEKTFERLKK